MSIEKSIALRRRNAEYLRNVALHWRPPVNRARRLEANIDLAQLPASPAESLNPDDFRLGNSKLGTGKLG